MTLKGSCQTQPPAAGRHQAASPSVAQAAASASPDAPSFPLTCPVKSQSPRRSATRGSAHFWTTQVSDLLLLLSHGLSAAGRTTCGNFNRRTLRGGSSVGGQTLFVSTSLVHVLARGGSVKPAVLCGISSSRLIGEQTKPVVGTCTVPPVASGAFVASLLCSPLQRQGELE